MGKNKTPADRSMTRSKAIKQGGFYNTDGDWNNIITREDYPDKIFRGRVEVLVFDGTKVYLVKSENGRYRIPGGGFDKGISNMDQVFMETKEEAKLIIKNIRYTGVTYVKVFEYLLPCKEGDIPYDGSVNEVYIADYVKHYDGYIRKELRDTELANKGKFYELEEVKDILQPAHIQALENMLQTKKITESSTNDKVTELIHQFHEILRNLHNNENFLCITPRDIEDDDGGYIFAEYNIESEQDADDLKTFIEHCNNLGFIHDVHIDEPVYYSMGYGIMIAKQMA